MPDALPPLPHLPPGMIEHAITRHSATQGGRPATDLLAVEEPLELRIGFGPREHRQVKPIATTMRTPTSPRQDFELAAGTLVSEGLLQTRSDLEGYFHCGPESSPLRLHNVVRMELAPHVQVDLARLERHFITSSSCGVCGKTTLDALSARRPAPSADSVTVDPDLLLALPDLLRHAQSVFDATGGLHAAALFDRDGKLLTLREDVGRHNALDKLVGAHFLADTLPLQNAVLLLSGRASFELLQKAAAARIGLVAAVGAPSSLAVDLAHRFGITLVGFLRDHRFNIYTHPHRIASIPAAIPQGFSP